MATKKDDEQDLPAKSEVDKQLPEGHVAAREQTGRPQSLQGMTDVAGHRFPVVISTGRTHNDERVMEAMLAENPPQPVVPAQDPTPLKAGDEVPVNPVTGELSLQGGPSRVISPVLPVHEGTVGQEGIGVVETDLSEVQAPVEPRVSETAAGGHSRAAAKDKS